MVFRVIEAVQPTLLIDETDTFVTENGELRGVLNSGHTRATAFVIRCRGDAGEQPALPTALDDRATIGDRWLLWQMSPATRGRAGLGRRR